MLKEEFSKALDLVKLAVILTALKKINKKYVSSTEISDKTILFNKEKVLPPAEIRRLFSKFDISAVGLHEGYDTDELKEKIYNILKENDFFVKNKNGGGV